MMLNLPNPLRGINIISITGAQIKLDPHLYSKNIEPRYIEKAVEKLLKESIDDDILEKLVLKKKSFFLREKNILKRKKKILDFLLRKGFSSDKIYKQLDHFLTLLDE